MKKPSTFNYRLKNCSRSISKSIAAISSEDALRALDGVHMGDVLQHLVRRIGGVLESFFESYQRAGRFSSNSG